MKSQINTNFSRRSFLKTAAGLASIPFFGKFFKWAKPLAKTSKAAEVVKSAGSGTTPPPYFFNLVNKIKNLAGHSDKIPNNPLLELFLI